MRHTPSTQHPPQHELSSLHCLKKGMYHLIVHKLFYLLQYLAFNIVKFKNSKRMCGVLKMN